MCFGSCFRTLAVILISDFCTLCYFDFFHNPPNSDMNYMIFNVRMLSFCMCMYMYRGNVHLSGVFDQQDFRE